jgi:hypothetical protein
MQNGEKIHLFNEILEKKNIKCYNNYFYDNIQLHSLSS